MSKKHGFRGTPVRPSPRPSTMGRIFETRGDPMVSQKEGQKDFGRNVATENPDYDRMFAPLARDLLKPQQVDRTNALGKLNAKKDTPQQRASSIVETMRRKQAGINKRANKVVQVGRSIHKEQDGVLPDNVPETNYEAGLRGKELGLSQREAAKMPTREKQTPNDVPHKSYYDFSGKSPPKEIKKNGKIHRRK